MSRSGAGRALARIYAMDLRPRFLAVSEWFPSDSPPAGLLLDKKGQRTFMSRALRPGGTLSSARPRRQPRPALDAPLPCGIQRICVRGFGRCRGFWLGLSYRWPVLERKKAENFYVAGRRLTRLYFAGYGGFVSAVLGSVIFSARIPLPLVCSCRKKAKNFYVAGRRLARLYFAGYTGFVSAGSGGAGAFGSGSPPAGLFLKERRQRTFTSRGGA